MQKHWFDPIKGKITTHPPVHSNPIDTSQLQDFETHSVQMSFVQSQRSEIEISAIISKFLKTPDTVYNAKLHVTVYKTGGKIFSYL